MKSLCGPDAGMGNGEGPYGRRSQAMDGRPWQAMVKRPQEAIAKEGPGKHAVKGTQLPAAEGHRDRPTIATKRQGTAGHNDDVGKKP